MRMFRRASAMVVLALLIGAPARSDGLGEVVVVTHIDIIPDFIDQAEPLLKQFVTDSRNDPGVKYFILITWDPTTNHFQMIEVFQNIRAFNAHVSAEHTVEFAIRSSPSSVRPMTSVSIGLFNSNSRLKLTI
jgi:quinol monooxygenase YgiN